MLEDLLEIAGELIDNCDEDSRNKEPEDLWISVLTLVFIAIPLMVLGIGIAVNKISPYVLFFVSLPLPVFFLFKHFREKRKDKKVEETFMQKKGVPLLLDDGRYKCPWCGFKSKNKPGASCSSCFKDLKPSQE